MCPVLALYVRATNLLEGPPGRLPHVQEVVKFEGREVRAAAAGSVLAPAPAGLSSGSSS